ncbi:K(+)/H(+) antiporter 1 [Grifola frondosa]|uniref:K(+)/H(+) antiporter 1 n=1 Tax=Grifola frondosa TaxID=5627 RepID=A0A1C7LW42_GRIFR|nr:K(+)/H(+) antiporter 1 [Grifola frondosa]
MREFSRAIMDITSSVLHKREAAEQGGLLDGQNPTAFNTADPLRLWIIQVGVIVIIAQLLALVLGKIRQPKVIAEVIGGIILGPTAFGRIPGFTEHIFPEASRPYLSLVANIGLCLFLFLVGLEIDAAVIRRNARLSVTVALAGMCLPFGLGAALSVPLYHTFIPSSVKFTNFMLFTGVAYSITAFPVLCRILTELKLLDTTVGIVVLSAGVGNDIIGWTLLALSVALVNAGSGLMALWILLTCVGWTLLLLFPVKLDREWTNHVFLTTIILLVFGSAFFTDIIGVHAIFGAFLAGLVVPREGGLTIALTEKLEDMVSIIFLPLYFTLSGLSTDLGLLNNGITWGYTIAICALAYFGKFGGCTLAARYAGFTWRESSTIGSLMSCKGLVELIVLNVGLSAGILSPRVFSMFVLEALLLTFMTTPAVTLLYPPQYRIRASATGSNFNNIHGETAADHSSRKSAGFVDGAIEAGEAKTRFTVILDKLEHLPGMMALTQLIQPPHVYSEKESSTSLDIGSASSHKQMHLSQEISIDALRIIELSDRTSAVMKSSNTDTLIATDPLLDIFGMFGGLNGFHVSPSLAVVPRDDLSSCVAEHAKRSGSQLVLVPWLPPHYSSVPIAESISEGDGMTPRASYMPNPFDALFKATSSSVDASASTLHSHFVRGVFAQCSTDVALYVDHHLPGGSPKFTVGGTYHLYLPFFGGPDDRLALDLVMQLCANPRVSATVHRVIKRELDLRQNHSADKPRVCTDEHVDDANAVTVASVCFVAGFPATGFPDTVYGNATTQTRLQSETADNIAWARYTSHVHASAALSRIEFAELPTPTPLHAVIERAASMVAATAENRSRLLVIAGRSRRLAAENHHTELKQLMEKYGGMGGEVKKTVGDVTAALVVSGCEASVVVLQAANVSID